MLDHFGVPVSNYEFSKAFYQQVFAALGGGLITDLEGMGHKVAGFGKNGKPDFWIHEGEVATGLHVAFTADNRAAVTAFYEAALAAGAKDNGAPGLRPMYHPNYFGAFALDPDGYNIEAVSHRPE